MSEAKTGDTVKVHYTGKLEDGTVFDSSRDRDPLEFTLGQGQVIPGFEQAVEGMEAGESKSASIPADEAYGERRDEMVIDVGLEEFPDDIEPSVGQQLQLRQGESTMTVRVTALDDESVTLDANHPLAGEDLTFDIELVDVD